MTVRGNAIPVGHTVYVAGRAVPVADDGSFVAQEILPSGVHTVEVAVLDEEGNGELYLRDIELEGKDWFYVGMADLTLTSNDSNGPIELLQGENSPNDFDSSADAQLAFFVNGKFNEHWRLTASADTRDGPLEDLFSNFLDKSPDSLFRRIDPDYHFPTFGDDGTVEEMAPTLGKFYAKVGRDESYGEWGNFQVDYMNNELAQVDRGLYGAKLHYESQRATSFGERRFALDGFTAEPGTIASREEFRGTGGSLYFLQRQDLLAGSERVRIEYRDRASGLVTAALSLTPGIDYDVDYLQGRLLLTEPLNATREDDLLVRDGAVQGDEAYLVVRYEYTPGFDEIDALSTGAQGHYWFGERVKVGLTANSNDEGDVDSGLEAEDVTVRISSDSWFKLQGAQTEGLIGNVVHSDDGGFGFAGYDDASFASAEAGGYRADVSLGLGDLFDRSRGRVTLYTQSLDGGYAAPGLQTLTDTENYGGTFQMPMTERLSLRAKSDHRGADLGLTASAHGAQRRLRAQRSLGRGHGRAHGRAPRRLSDRAADARAGRAHRRRRSGRLRFQAPLEHLRLRARHGVDRRRSRGERSRRHGRLVPNRGAREDRRRGVERRLGRRRQGPHELPAQRSYDVVLELRARERAHRQRLARHARQRRQHRRRRQDASVGQHQRVSRGALSEQRRLLVGSHALDGYQLGAHGAAQSRCEHRHRHAAQRGDGSGDASAKPPASASATGSPRCSSRAAWSIAPTRPSSPISRSTRARRGSCGTTSSGSFPTRRACSASSITPRA